MTALIREKKRIIDFSTKTSREDRLCTICNCECREAILNDHLRDHNKHGDSYYIDTAKFEIMLEEVNFFEIMTFLLRAMGL